MESELTSPPSVPILDSQEMPKQPTPSATQPAPESLPSAQPESRTFRVSVGPSPELLHYLSLGYKIVK